jgi:hypothetical protein
MQQRIKTALVPAIVLVTLALGAAQLGTADAETRPKRFDELSAKRPAAASELASTAPYGIAQAVTETASGAFMVDVVRKVQSDLAAAAAAEQEADRSSYGPTSGYATGGSGGGGGDVGDFLACTRAHESDSAGGYGAVSPGGTYRGAYQFHQNTWNNTAASAGRDDLVGVDPAAVAPADQDAMATHLYSSAGSSPWGGRCG